MLAKDICSCGHLRHQHLFYGGGPCGWNKQGCVCVGYTFQSPAKKADIIDRKIRYFKAAIKYYFSIYKSKAILIGIGLIAGYVVGRLQ